MSVRSHAMHCGARRFGKGVLSWFTRGREIRIVDFWPSTSVACHASSHPEGVKTGMPARLFNRLIEKLCPHRFSWPHSGANGQDYQVCLICGSAYEYDWITMRRTGRVTTSADLESESLSRKQPEA